MESRKKSKTSYCILLLKALEFLEEIENSSDPEDFQRFCRVLYNEKGKRAEPSEIKKPIQQKGSEAAWNQSVLYKNRNKPQRVPRLVRETTATLRQVKRTPLRKEGAIDSTEEIFRYLLVKTLQGLHSKYLVFRTLPTHTLLPRKLTLDLDHLLSLGMDSVETIRPLRFNDFMSDHFKRMASFSNWPMNAPMSALRMVDAGFYLDCQSSKVNCFDCGFQINSMQELENYIADEKSRNDGPGLLLRMHNRLRSDCSFAKDELRRNGQEAIDVSQNQSTSLSSVFSNLSLMQEKESNIRNDIGPIDSNNVYRNQGLNSRSTIDSPLIRGQSTVDSPIANNYLLVPKRNLNGAESGYESSNWRSENNSIVQNDTSQNSTLDGTVLSGNFSSKPGQSYHASLLSQMYSGGPTSAALQNIATEGAGALPSATYEEKYDYSLKHPQYDNLPARIESFRNWPWDEKQNYRNLIPAGFFYTGIIIISSANKVWRYICIRITLGLCLVTSYMGSTFLTPCLIWTIFHTIVIHDPRCVPTLP